MAEDAEGQVNPDFLLIFQEGFYDKASRRCWRVRRIAVAEEDDYLLVRVDPPMVRKNEELPNSETRYFILAPRWVGVSLFEILEWPVFVNILIPSTQAPVALDSLEAEDVSFIAIGEIVPAGPTDSTTRLPGGGVHVGTARPLPQRRSPKHLE